MTCEEVQYLAQYHTAGGWQRQGLDPGLDPCLSDSELRVFSYNAFPFYLTFTMLFQTNVLAKTASSPTARDWKIGWLEF